MFHIGWFAALTGLASAAAQSPKEIYLTTGEHGELSFSDVAEPGAERVDVETVEPADDALAELERRIAQTLTVANALEASRLAREKARAEARALDARAEPEPLVVYEDRYVSYPYVLRSPYDDRFSQHRRFKDPFDKRPHHRKDKRDHEPKARTRSRQFLYDADRQ